MLFARSWPIIAIADPSMSNLPAFSYPSKSELIDRSSMCLIEIHWLLLCTGRRVFGACFFIPKITAKYVTYLNYLISSLYRERFLIFFLFLHGYEKKRCQTCQPKSLRIVLRCLVGLFCINMTLAALHSVGI